MSLFRKPKKAIHRRVFSTIDDEEGDSFASHDNGSSQRMDVYEHHSFNHKKQEKKDKLYDKKLDKQKGDPDSKQPKSKPLLSFADNDEDEEDEVFQVRKSSHSKKVMRMMDKERRKKKAKEEKDYDHHGSTNSSSTHHENGLSTAYSTEAQTSNSASYRIKSDDKFSSGAQSVSSDQGKSKKSDYIEKEIRTDDFVLVVKKSEPVTILNGRAAFCAGKDDMSDEDNEADSNDDDSKHMFSKPENLKQMLESGSIPDAAMIHAARKRRQKAREQSDIIPIEEPKDVANKKGKRLNREDEVQNSDEEERVDMNAITGKKELEERREQFYSVENNYSDDDSDRETNEWENQQIRKGVTGAQLVTVQQESVLSRFMIKSSNNQSDDTPPQSTSTLLDEAYARNSIERPRQLTSSRSKKDSKVSALRTPQEITDSIKTRLIKLKETNEKHKDDIERITTEIQLLKLEKIDCSQKAPTAAVKYRFYQEINGYVSNLVECLNEKAPKLAELEKRALQILSKHPSYLVERRRQDVRDQVKEMTESSSKCLGSAIRRGPEHEEIIKRTAERECRRTRRRCEREKSDLSSTHLDGMSSDDEVSDRFLEQKKLLIDQLEVELDDLFADAGDEFCKPELILSKFNVWRKTDMESYKDAFVSLCLPKIMGPLVRTEILIWNPLNEDYKDIENMNWYSACMLYGWSENETEKSLLLDPDMKLVPVIIDQILLPKITEIVSNCWDPMSTTQSLRLIGLINRIGRDYPIREYSNQLKLLFDAILTKLKSALDNDVFIPIFPKQILEARTSFFQRQLCIGLKLFRNFLSWQGIIADRALRDLAITSLLNRYLLLAMRMCSTNDALSKAYIVVNTLPTAWLQLESETLQSLQPFIVFIKSILGNFDSKNPLHMQAFDKAKQILQRLHSW